ncbi:MAG: hypothetical protein ACFBSD_13905 [Paracoccaceae bacterium]
MTAPSHPAARLGTAASLMIDELAEKTRWQAELEESLAEVKAERDRLMRGIEAIVAGLDPVTAKSYRSAIYRQNYEILPVASKIGQTAKSRAALWFLATNEHQTIRAAELTYYLRREGFACTARYAAQLLAAWLRKGIVTREGRGRYALVMGHPEVVRLRLRSLES